MTDEELDLICDEAARLPVALGFLLEVGVYLGRTTTALARIGPTIAVDWFLGSPEITPRHKPEYKDYHRRRTAFLANLRDEGVAANVIIVEGASHQTLAQLHATPVRLAVIDGDHSEAGALRDIENVWDMLSGGGTLFLDDYEIGLEVGRLGQHTHGGPRRAWETFAARRGMRLNVERCTFYYDGEVPPRLGCKLARIRKPR